MNKQQAINLLKNLEQSLDDYCELNDEGKTAFRMAIEALNCSEFPNNSDTISRQAAIDVADAVWSVTGDKNVAKVWDQIKDLPAAQQEQRWIPCSERLPETHKAGNSVSGIFMESKPVLVYGVPEYESEYSFNVVTYCDDLNGNTYWSTEMDAVTINEVTAWMPLPESYRGANE